jgi:hypothetical protein
LRDTEQFSGLLGGQQRILRNDGDALAVGHRRRHLNQGLEHRLRHLQAATVGSDQGRLGLRNGDPAPGQLSHEVNDLGQLPSLEEVRCRFPARRPRAHFVSVFAPVHLQNNSSTKKTKTSEGGQSVSQYSAGGVSSADTLARVTAARRPGRGDVADLPAPHAVPERQPVWVAGLAVSFAR